MGTSIRTSRGPNAQNHHAATIAATVVAAVLIGALAMSQTSTDAATPPPAASQAATASQPAMEDPGQTSPEVAMLIGRQITYRTVGELHFSQGQGLDRVMCDSIDPNMLQLPVPVGAENYYSVVVNAEFRKSDKIRDRLGAQSSATIAGKIVAARGHFRTINDHTIYTVVVKLRECSASDVGSR